jgi:hypothetical protein
MDEPIVEVARVIRVFLPELVGPVEAGGLDARIADILNASPSENALGELGELLNSQEATSDFMAEVLADAPDFRPPKFQPRTLRDAGFQPLPGSAPPAHAGKFGCPNDDYVWYRRTSSTPIPVCPTHSIALVRLA